MGKCSSSEIQQRGEDRNMRKKNLVGVLVAIALAGCSNAVNERAMNIGRELCACHGGLLQVETEHTTRQFRVIAVCKEGTKIYSKFYGQDT